MLSTVRILKEEKAALILEHARAEDIRGLDAGSDDVGAASARLVGHSVERQCFALAYCRPDTAGQLVRVRVFARMHECGHDSLFRTQRLNRTFDFLLGVLSGMPQYVWSQHHSYHHAHNGDWEKCRIGGSR